MQSYLKKLGGFLKKLLKRDIKLSNLTIINKFKLKVLNPLGEDLKSIL